MCRWWRVWWSLVGLCCWVLSAHAATYYVATNGNNGNPGTDAQPWLTLQKAVDTMLAGDTTLVKNGTYTAGIVVPAAKDGTPGARFVLKSQNKWGAIINASILVILDIKGDYWDIQDFDILGVGGGATGTVGQFGVNSYGSNNRILGNKVRNLRSYHCDNTPAGQAGTGIIDGNPGDGNSNTTVSGNFVFDNGGGSAAACPTGRGPHGIYIVHTGTVTNNVVYNNRGFGIHIFHEPHDILIANNLVFNNGKDGILIQGDQANVFNVQVIGNIVRNNVRRGIHEVESVGVNTFINNTSFNNTMENFLLVNTATGSLTTDPLHVNYQNNGSGNYHLQATSPAKDSSSVVTAATPDLDGVVRPQGSAYDRGPYEYFVATPPVLPPQNFNLVSP